MKRRLSIVLLLCFLLTACTPAQEVPAPAAASVSTAEPAPEPEPTPTPAPTPADPIFAADLAAAEVLRMAFWDALTGSEDGTMEWNWFTIRTAFDPESGETVIHLNDRAAVRFDGTCELSGLTADLTGDGAEELILFLRPAMSNLVYGDLYVFSDAAEELLVFSGRGPESLTPEAGRPFLTVPDGFVYPEEPTYRPGHNQLCFRADVLLLPEGNVLRITHDIEEWGSVCSYVAWEEGGFEVILQEPSEPPMDGERPDPAPVREHLGRPMDPGSMIRASYTGGDDGLFEAMYRALTERFWTNPAEAMRKAVDVLPPGTSGSLETDFSFRYNRDTDPERFEKWVLEDMDIACIMEEDIDGGLLIVFDIREDGGYIPFLALELDYRKDSWMFREYGGERWLIREHAVLYGTGQLMVQCDWYNLDRGGIPISYLCQATEVSAPPCPLGDWGFIGELSQWQAREDDEGFFIEMEAVHRLERYNAYNVGEEWLGEELIFSGSEPLCIRYDSESGEARAERMEQWYFQIPDGDPTTEAYRLPFQKELREAAAGEGITALWAEWVLQGGGHWRDYFAGIGLEPPQNRD